MRRADRAHDVGTLNSVLGAAPPPAGGLDLSLPGDGIRLAATRWPGSGTPVVLLHGLASQRRFWNLVVPHLAGLPLLAIDQRGHGDSERPLEGYDATTVAGDLTTAMDALGWSRAVVVGHSWGAAVAAAFAHDRPERALAMVGIDGGFGRPRAAGPDRDELRRRLTPPLWAASPEEVVATLRSQPPGGRWTDEVAAAVLPIFEVGVDGLARARLPFDTHMTIIDAMLEMDLVAVLEGVTCPVWLVSCEPVARADEWAHAKAAAFAELAQRLPAPRLFRWVGAVHDVPLQWPELVAGLIRSVVSDTLSAGGSEA